MGVVKDTGYFSELARNVFKVAYKFSLNIKSTVSNMLEFEKVLKDDNIKTEHGLKRKIDSIQNQRPKVDITIEHIRDWKYFMNNGALNETGLKVKKDTSVYREDKSRINKWVEYKNRQIKDNAYNDFKRKK